MTFHSEGYSIYTRKASGEDLKSELFWIKMEEVEDVILKLLLIQVFIIK